MIATVADIPFIIDLCREAHGGSVWEDVGAAFDEGSCEAAIRGLMDNPDAVVLVCDRGTLWLVRFPLWFNQAETIANELFFYATKGGDALRYEAARWVGEGLTTLSRHEKTDTRLETIYRRAGFQALEHTFIRRL